MYYRDAATLNVNYLHVARAAQFCFAHFSMLLYIELWAREQLEQIMDHSGYQPFATDVTKLDIIYQEQDEHIRKTLHGMLKNVSLSLFIDQEFYYFLNRYIFNVFVCLEFVSEIIPVSIY